MIPNLFSAFLFFVLASTALAEEPIQRDAPHEVMPQRLWDFKHLHLSLRLDVKAGQIMGHATHTVEPLKPDHSFVRLHQEGLEIQGVWVDETPVQRYKQRSGALDIPVTPGQPHTIRVQYSATPETGLHFRAPNTSGNTIWEVWSQGESMDNRYWFPGWDYPNDRFTYSADFTVSDDLHVVSNGALTKRVESSPGEMRFEYTMEQELVNYLVMVAAGEYSVFHQEGAVPLEYIVAKGVSEDVALRSFGGAKEQLTFFNDLLQNPYPYPVYRQVAVQGFLYGGMENTTATVMSDHLLRREAYDVRRSPESVTAHELAHQWFGDLLTCYGWRELWLNEGFASYYQMRWFEHKYGEELAAVELFDDLRAAARNGRPMSPRAHSKQGQSDNADVYTQGLSVLRVLELHLGREAFDAAIAEYVSRHRDSLVESEDLRRTLEDVSGHHLGWIFDQWVTGPGTPSITASSSWKQASEGESGQLTVTLKQTTKEGLFHLPVEIEIGTKTDALLRKVWLGEGTTTLQVDLDEEPLWVVADPRGGTIAKWKRTSSTENWTHALQHSPHPYARLVAMAELADGKANKDGVAALGTVMNGKNHHPIFRKRAVRALGKLATPQARKLLIAASDEPEPQVRQGIIQALGKVPVTPEVLRVLRKHWRTDAHPDVRAAALVSLSLHSADDALHRARAAVNQPLTAKRHSPLQSALRILAKHGTVDDVARLLNFLKPRVHQQLRKTTAWNFLQLFTRLDESEAKQVRPQISRALELFLEDDDLRVRETGVYVLDSIGDLPAATRLVAFANSTTIAALRESARNAASSIRQRRPSKDPAKESKDIKRIEERIQELEKRLKEVEKWR